MKRIKIIGIAVLFFAAMLGIAVGGCKSEEEPEEPKFRINNESDSLAFSKIVELARSAYPECFGLVKLEDTETWKNMVEWEYDPNTKQNYIAKLELVGQSSGYGELRISDMVGELSHLRSLSIINGSWGGELPSTVSRLRNLQELTISRTCLTSLPDDIFNPSMINVVIEYNELLTKIPPSVSLLADWKETERLSFISNGFTGKCPPLRCSADFSDCNIISCEWNSIYGLTGLVSIKSGGVFIGNRLSGEVPQEIMNDTVALYRLFVATHPQQNGYGFSNMPPDDEVERMYDEYCKNHSR